MPEKNCIEMWSWLKLTKIICIGNQKCFSNFSMVYTKYLIPWYFFIIIDLYYIMFVLCLG